MAIKRHGVGVKHCERHRLLSTTLRNWSFDENTISFGENLNWAMQTGEMDLIVHFLSIHVANIV